MFRVFLLPLLGFCAFVAFAAEVAWPPVPDPIGLGPRLATIDWLQGHKILVPANATDEQLVELWAEASGLRAQQREEQFLAHEAEERKRREAREAQEKVASAQANAQALAIDAARQRADEGTTRSDGTNAPPVPRDPGRDAVKPVAADDQGTPTPLPWFSGNSGKTEVMAEFGQPDATYWDGKAEYLLFRKVYLNSDGERFCPEVLLEDDRLLQINHIPEKTMRAGIAAAKGFAGWVPPTAITAKTFSLEKTNLLGSDHAQAVTALGQPDVKKIFNGKEIWVYRQCPFASDPDGFISIYLTFEDGKVTDSSGN